MNETEHGHEDFGIDSAYSLRPCRPYVHQHRDGERKHVHVGVSKADGTLVTAGTIVNPFRGDALDTELLRRAEEAYPALADAIQQVRDLGLRSDEAGTLREQLADAMNDWGLGRLTGADVSQIRSGTFERMGF